MLHPPKHVPQMHWAMNTFCLTFYIKPCKSVYVDNEIRQGLQIFRRSRDTLAYSPKTRLAKVNHQSDTCLKGIYTPSHRETDQKLPQDRFCTDSFGRYLGHQYRSLVVTVLVIQLAQNEQLDFVTSLQCFANSTRKSSWTCGRTIQIAKQVP